MLPDLASLEKRLAGVEEVLRGTRFKWAKQGAVITAQGIGAALSTTLAGLVTVHAGYGAAFLTLGACGGLGAMLFQLAMPETAGSPARQTAQGDAHDQETRAARTRCGANTPIAGRTT